ncbi:PIG-L family deacetylase [Mesonia maritima]|uniref:LmbE family N-acetylglucosaminyl deacetylase n=1 Tax=Mesonia maritima TaxID=1793873 RepID=A0ABU1K536_9FLAO|nr:PIG-L family deacetylase [Mesonia maritima]MDR6300721.1 LmbE family N-acetylglucosaminyl deacetylase [Mesonia maritima]
MKKILVLGLAFSINFSNAQTPEKLNSSEIYQAIEQLNFLGSVLYLAAHPDDENTKLISYFSNKVHARTAYLSLTRGDGGQNLIGPEIRESLGLIRTQELLAARKIDGGQQFFSRANDFGYSKTPQETLEIWNENEVLSDVVWVIRKFQPDVIINRFDHRTEGTTHGHHTASAQLSLEAFKIANDKNAFSDQLKFYDTWQPKRLFFNTSWWFYGSQEKFEEADKSSMMSVDVGTYFPLKGISNTEIASKSRSQHKSQGFGNTPNRGTENEYIELIKGDFPKNSNSVFEGIDTSWNRVKGGKKIGEILEEVLNNYDFKNPSKSLPNLVKAYQFVQKLENEHWKRIKTNELKKIILACSGMYLEAVSSEELATPSEKIQLKIEAINRSETNIQLKEITINPLQKKLSIQQNLAFNTDFTQETTIEIPENFSYSNPYWLEEESSLGMYTVKNQQQRGLPENQPTLTAEFTLDFGKTSISFEKPIVYKTNDPVKGEVYKPFSIVPKVSIATENSTVVFNSEEAKEITVNLKAFADNVKGELKISAPKNWKISPEKVAVDFNKKGESKKYTFTVIPPKEKSEVFISPVFKTESQTFSQELELIEYDHIPTQTVLKPAKTKFIKLSIEKRGNKIAYIEGAGDVVPESLRIIGYQVDILTPEEITAENLKKYDAVVIGIRAYNTVESLAYKQPILYDFVANGGNMIVQYNTNRGLKTDNLSPFSLELSRDRVTDEYSNVDFLAPKHPVLNYPNKITSADFEGWVQERGLYFPDKWDENFTPIFGMHDKNETETKGSLLVAPYGKGYYIYTGLSFFREFPAGVSGAYRLFANLISIGK